MVTQLTRQPKTDNGCTDEKKRQMMKKVEHSSKFLVYCIKETVKNLGESNIDIDFSPEDIRAMSITVYLSCK